MGESVPNVPCWIATQTLGRKPYVVTSNALDHDTPALAIPTAKVEKVRKALSGAPIISKYHGQRGFDVERFIADYSDWGRTAREALALLEPHT